MRDEKRIRELMDKINSGNYEEGQYESIRQEIRDLKHGKDEKPKGRQPNKGKDEKEEETKEEE